jgi:hypothetical protein
MEWKKDMTLEEAIQMVFRQGDLVKRVIARGAELDAQAAFEEARFIVSLRG